MGRYALMLYLCCDFGEDAGFGLLRLKGNRVKIPDSTRCCKLLKSLRNFLPLCLGRHGKASEGE